MRARISLSHTHRHTRRSYNADAGNTQKSEIRAVHLDIILKTSCKDYESHLLDI